MPDLKSFFSWSTGKDSALALHYLLQRDEYRVEHLLTTVNAHYQRVTMHGLPVALLEQQIDALGIPGTMVQLPQHASYDDYEACMREAVLKLKADGCNYAAFGDIFLEDLKEYRVKQMAAVDVETVFPIWQRDTTELIHEFIDAGFKAIVVCANAALLDESFVGRVIDSDFVRDLPAGVDPCGENGEFHTFCFDGPIFSHPIAFSVGETVLREYEHDGVTTGFWFCDLIAGAPS